MAAHNMRRIMACRIASKFSMLPYVAFSKDAFPNRQRARCPTGWIKSISPLSQTRKLICFARSPDRASPLYLV